MNITVINREKYDAVWATPLSGYGHLADEQPLPYIHMNGVEKTPRFGGEFISKKHIPLPMGVLKSNWPLKQRIFNLFRKRVNIYWREVFSSFSRADKYFYFYEQCRYKNTENGFLGSSPIIQFERSFFFEEDTILVKDHLAFKEKIEFHNLLIAQYCMSSGSDIAIKSTRQPNFVLDFKSSTGSSKIFGTQLNNVVFYPGDEIEWQIHYHLPTSL
ncbi:hypothetical protein VCSRO187_3472 [Vibrio cholerae]|nr:hypothetical protein [Vibrio cholerae]GIB53080.1 hypothetical protein VCSRO187_3472 [Vibrio cholerae]